ncbi:hypothetical protein pb186bvf_020544 [Paramecium bursaria]
MNYAQESLNSYIYLQYCLILRYLAFINHDYLFDKEIGVSVKLNFLKQILEQLK